MKSCVAVPQDGLVLVDFIVSLVINSASIFRYAYVEDHSQEQCELDADRAECRKQPGLHAVQINHFFFLIISNGHILPLQLKLYLTDKSSHSN
jgi:hypothetical protein